MIDRQAIERRDFPIARRGYDPAAVDAHLRSLAAEFEQLHRALEGAEGQTPLATAASTQVRSIIEAAETTAAEIERQTLEASRRTRDEADSDAQRTREDAIAKARAHLAAVAAASTQLLERVGTMDGEVAGLIESLRAGAGRLGRELGTLDASIGELYDASSGRAPAERSEGEPAPPAPVPPLPGASAGPAPARPAPAAPAPAESAPAEPAPPSAGEGPEQPPAPLPAAAPGAAAEGGDVDGARLIALNMALNGESRADTDRYLAEHFALPDRAKLVEEVYAAVEG